MNDPGPVVRAVRQDVHQSRPMAAEATFGTVRPVFHPPLGALRGVGEALQLTHHSSQAALQCGQR